MGVHVHAPLVNYIEILKKSYAYVKVIAQETHSYQQKLWNRA